MIIADRMKRNPITAVSDMSVEDVAYLMLREKVFRLPVLDLEKNLVGVVTESDVLKAIGSPSTALTISAVESGLAKISITKIMDKSPIIIDEKTPIEDAARLMGDNDLAFLSVVRGPKLVGVISRNDLLGLLLEMLGARTYGVRVSFVIDDRPGAIRHIVSLIAEEGLDIVSFGTFRGTNPTNMICTAKIHGCHKEELVDLINPSVSEILDIRET